MSTPIVFRWIPGFPGYLIGSDGSLWSRWTCGRYKRLGFSWRRVRGSPVHEGHHRYVTLRGEGGARRGEYLHRLVLEAFVGPCPPGMEGCHADDDGTNNRVDNLRWDTSAGNKADMVRHGNSNRGERHPLAKLAAGDVREIRRELAAGEKHKDIANRRGITRKAVGDIALGRRWGWLLNEDQSQPTLYRRHKSGRTLA